MEEAKKKIQEICELKDKLVCGAKEYVNQGLQSVNTHEMGEVTDMIKDLAEAEEKLWKACYYKKIVEAMHEEKEEEELLMKLGKERGMDDFDLMGYRRGSRGRMGYDHWRYSSGRFAPKGRGHYSSGYTPMMMDAEDWDEDDWERAEEMMGYSGGDRGGSSGGSRGGSRGGNRSGGSSGSYGGSGSSGGRMGYPMSDRGSRYERYARARQGYHESKDATSREHMDSAARDYVVDTAETIKEIWKDAEPSTRKELRNKLSSLLNEMN